jgi:DNA-directed RNA polymerase specialized sigma24 family protein
VPERAGDPADSAADNSLAGHAAGVAKGDRAAEALLVARLEPLIPKLYAIVRRGRPKDQAGRVHTTSVVYDALFDLLEWLRKHDPAARIGADDVRRVLFHITRMRLLDALRGSRRNREVQTDDGAPLWATAPAREPSDIPRHVLKAIEDSSAGPAGPARPDGQPGNPHLARAAVELVEWLENWGTELRSVHPKAIEIIEWSFCGWSTEQIGQILNLKKRSVQLIKQRLLPLMEQRLGLGDNSDGTGADGEVHTRDEPGRRGGA